MVVVMLTKFLWVVYLIKLHHILSGFWIWPTFQGHIGQSSKKLRSCRILLLFDLECCNLVWILCTWAPSTYTPNFGPIGFQIWQPGHNLFQVTFCNNQGYWPETLYMCTPRSWDLPDRNLIYSDSWLGHQGAKTENKITPELIAGWSLFLS
jgi:hypothetical protein